MQLSLNAFVARGATAAQQRQLREKTATEAEAKKASEAARIGLAWPRCGRRRVGAPSRQDRWVELLYAQINQGLLIPEGLTANVPGWWTPGQSLVSAVDALSAELAEIPTPTPPPSADPVVDAAAIEAVEAPDPEAVGVPPKKRYKTMDPDVKEWFLTTHDVMVAKHNWGLVRALRWAKQVAPELFAHLHPDTPRKWKAEPLAEKRGRRSLLSAGVVSHLASTAERICEAFPVGASVMKVVFEEELKAMKIYQTLSLRTVQRFMETQGFTFRAKGCARKTFTDAQAQDAIDNVAQKLAYVMDLHDIPKDRVINLDETSCRMIPLAARGWAKVRDASKWRGDKLAQATVLLAARAVPGPLWAQAIFKGKTTRGTPIGPLPLGVRVDFAPSHWTNCDSFYSMFEWIDSDINATSPGRPWIALLDCASVHISKEFLSKAREGLPWVKKIYIPAGYTSVAQPLDVAFMKAFKCAMARTAGEHFARCVLQQEPGAPVQVEMGAQIIRPIFVAWVANAIKQIDKEIHFSKGWESIMPTDSRAVLAAAHEVHARGDLFRQVKGRVIPEDQDGDIVVAEDAADDEANEEDDADEGLLVEEFDTDEGAVVEHAGAPAGAASSSSSDPAPPAEVPRPATILSTLEKVMALRLVYGRGP